MGMKPPTLVCCDASLSQVLAAAVPSPDGRPRDFRLPCEAGAGTCPRGTSPVLRGTVKRELPHSELGREGKPPWWP